MSRFFIDRPVFAWVIAIIIMFAGALAITSLPIAQYPSIAPPAIAVTATYPGASAKTLEDTVTQVIEQKLNGIDHLRYIESQSTSAGTVQITVTFDGGTNPDTAQVQVQNKVALATPLLPQEVQQLGVSVTKSVNNFLMVLGFVSEDGSMSNADIADFNVSFIQDPISRLPGVGDIQNFGTQYAMRIWLNPDKLTKYQLATERCRGRGARAECASLRGRARRLALHAGAVAQRDDHGAKPAANAGAIWRHPAAREYRWLARPAARCRAGRTRQRELHHAGPLQRQARRRHGDQTRGRRQCAGHRERREKEGRGTRARSFRRE